MYIACVYVYFQEIKNVSETKMIAFMGFVRWAFKKLS
jgi:hypothetical protein